MHKTILPTHKTYVNAYQTGRQLLIPQCLPIDTGKCLHQATALQLLYAFLAPVVRQEPGIKAPLGVVGGWLREYILIHHGLQRDVFTLCTQDNSHVSNMHIIN